MTHLPFHRSSLPSIQIIGAKTIKRRLRGPHSSPLFRPISSINRPHSSFSCSHPTSMMCKTTTTEIYKWRHFSSAPQRIKEEPNACHNDTNDTNESNNPTAQELLAKLTRAKQERRQLHADKQTAAAQKRRLARRSSLSQNWMSLFASSDVLFRATLKELNVNVDTDVKSSLQDYKSFYLDSLNSFGEALAEEDAESGIAPESFEVLDQFGESVLSDLAYLKQYRVMCGRLKRKEKLEATLKDLTERHSKGVESLEEREKALHSIKEEEANLDSTATSNDTNENIQDFEELERLTANVLSNLLSKESDTLTKETNKISQLKDHLASLSKRINTTQTEISKIDLPLSEDEFAQATTNLMSISSKIIPSLAKFITTRHSNFEQYRRLEHHTDLTKPHEWYPRARLDKRKIIFHAGPTNSGKTYNALLRLRQAEKGMYLAPLRLLAAECYENLTSDGVYTSLITGQEQRDVPFATHRSSTVELADLENDYDVVVIDEIQMISDDFRGFAWTRALMGVRCKEVHLAGGLEAGDIVKKIAGMCGDEFEMKRYERFGELRVEEDSLAGSNTEKGSYSKVQPGDCVVCFSRTDIFAVKKEIEKATDYKCCVIYGTLPPEIRSEQARLFNDPNSEYKILIASDAIGMGLNLSIRRIIFNSLYKFSGGEIVRLDHSLVKQIAGRAGRRNSPYPHGLVTCRNPADMKYLKQCMSTEISLIKQAGLIPTEPHIALFDELLKEYGLQKKKGLHETLRKFGEMATVQGDFFICRKEHLEKVSRWLEDTEMSTDNKFRVCMSPVKDNDGKSKAVLLRYVEKHSLGKVPGIHRSMRPREAESFIGLNELCSVYNQLELFLWLLRNLPSNNAVEEVRAEKFKEDTIDMINRALKRADKLSLGEYCYVKKDNDWRGRWTAEQRKKSEDDQFTDLKETFLSVLT